MIPCPRAAHKLLEDVGIFFYFLQVAFAQQFGAAGIILYSDPADYAVGVNSTYEATFPNSWWLPPSGVQRGSTFIGNGDPLTPGYPAKSEYHLAFFSSKGALHLSGLIIGRVLRSLVLICSFDHSTSTSESRWSSG